MQVNGYFRCQNGDSDIVSNCAFRIYSHYNIFKKVLLWI